ncbi:MAG: hypothetical protein HY560_08730 [Gemmatimonadetes bacterium]|nr:hypothetical protein [Gemmatimonadota bacterium]
MREAREFYVIRTEQRLTARRAALDRRSGLDRRAEPERRQTATTIPEDRRHGDRRLKERRAGDDRRTVRDRRTRPSSLVESGLVIREKPPTPPTGGSRHTRVA